MSNLLKQMSGRDALDLVQMITSGEVYFEADNAVAIINSGRDVQVRTLSLVMKVYCFTRTLFAGEGGYAP